MVYILQCIIYTSFFPRLTKVGCSAGQHFTKICDVEIWNYTKHIAMYVILYAQQILLMSRQR